LGFADTLLGLAELSLEVPNPSVHRAEIFLGGEVQSSCDALEVPICHALDAALQAKRPDR
jgi:hypothetical protein